MHDNALYAAAQEYARRGWTVIPIRDGKRPALRSWREFQTRKPTPAELSRWFGNGRKLAGLAVLLGTASGGLIVRDFDEPGAYGSWAAGHTELAALLPTVETPRGAHVYATSQWSGYVACGNGELRGDAGHYVCLPPSMHPSGIRYRWLVPLPDGPLPLADPFLVGLAPSNVATQRPRDPETHAIRGAASLRDAILATLPTKPGQRNRALFAFVRRVRGMAEYVDADETQLEAVARAWYEAALPNIGTPDFETTWLDFLYGWRRVRCPWGAGYVAQAFADATKRPPPKVAERYSGHRMRALVALCAELQRRAGDGAFWLSCRDAAAILDWDHSTAARALSLLVDDGILRIVKPGGTAETRRHATEYRFVASCDSERGRGLELTRAPS